MSHRPSQAAFNGANCPILMRSLPITYRRVRGVCAVRGLFRDEKWQMRAAAPLSCDDPYRDDPYRED
jgi:hypothetical protein